MRRILIILSVLGALLAGIFSLPLAWVAPSFMPAIAGQNLRYSGTVWQGSVQNIDLMGQANFKLSPLQIFGKTPLTLEAGNGRNALSGKLGRQHISDLILTLNVADLPLPDQRLAGLQGTANLAVTTAQFDERCESAAGTIRTDILQRNGGKFAWTGPILQGPVRCENGNVVVELSGQDQTQTIRGTITIDPVGTYAADLSVRTAQPEAGAVLPIFGFSQQGDEFKLSERGRWR